MARSNGRDALEAGREALERGKVRPALRRGWDATQAGIAAQDTALLADARRFAEAVGEQATGKDLKEADTLMRYTREALAQAESGVKPAGLLAGLFSRGRTRTKKCPDCAEEIKADARVCRYCGYRYPES